MTDETTPDETDEMTAHELAVQLFNETNKTLSDIGDMARTGEPTQVNTALALFPLAHAKLLQSIAASLIDIHNMLDERLPKSD